MKSTPVRKLSTDATPSQPLGSPGGVATAAHSERARERHG